MTKTEKYEERRKSLQRLSDSLGWGGIKKIAESIGKEPSYVSRMLYPEWKPGRKKITEYFADLIEKQFPGWNGSVLFPAEKPQQIIPAVPLIAKSDISSAASGCEVTSKPAPTLATLLRDHTAAGLSTFAYIEDLDSISHRIEPCKTLVLVDPDQKITDKRPSTLYLFKLSAITVVGYIKQTPSGLMLCFTNPTPGWEPVPVQPDQCLGRVVATLSEGADDIAI